MSPVSLLPMSSVHTQAGWRGGGADLCEPAEVFGGETCAGVEGVCESVAAAGGDEECRGFASRRGVRVLVHEGERVAD